MELNESMASAATAAPPVDPSLPLGPRRANASRKAGVQRAVKPKAIDAPKPVAKAGADGGQDGIVVPAVVVSQDAPMVPARIVRPREGTKGKGKAKGGKGGEEEGEDWEGETNNPHASVAPKKKPGPMGGEITESAWARVIQAAGLGLAMDKWWGVSGVGEQRFRRILARDAWRRDALRAAAISGEMDMQIVVQACQPGWQGSAWLLERTRGYVARHGVEHSGPGGRPLSVVAQVFATLEAPAK